MKQRGFSDSRSRTLRTPPPPASTCNFKFQPNVAVWRFPEWIIVQETQITKQGFRRRRLVHMNSLDSGKYRDVDGRM